jgi:RNA polymerase sigma-70 factor (ECF subfamily)
VRPRGDLPGDESGDDRALVRRLLGGDEAAFAVFFDRSFAPLYRFAAARLGGDAQGAQEVVQETLVKALPRLGAYRGEAPLLAWLFAICRHEAGAWLRRRARAGVALIEEEPEVRAVLASLAARAATPEDEALRSELARLVQRTLDALPARYGDALEWKYVHGLTVAEIGARLGVGVKAAESLLGRARGAFRQAFLEVEGAALVPVDPDSGAGP